MAKVKKGDTVKVHYTGTLTDGTVFDSSREREPIEFEVGAGMMIKGFDAGVKGLAVGDTKVLEIAAADAYGERRDDMMFGVPKDQLPPDLTVEVGMKLMLPTSQGPVPVVVSEVTDETITLDANHELAGKDLIFDIEVMEIVE